MDRRSWLKRLIPDVGDDTGSAAGAPAPPPQRRPPGAVPEALFLERCSRCGDCVRACPHAAVHVYNPGTGILEGTPVMLPERRACHMCEGFPCASVCETQALRVPEGATWRLGTAAVDAARCIPFLGPECGACRDLCPEGVDALRLQRGRPVVDRDACLGCGLCIAACPVEPAALTIEPLTR